MPAKPRQGRIIEATRQKFDTYSFLPFGFKLLGQILFDRPPFSHQVDGFLVLLQNATDEGNADAIAKLRELVEGFTDDFREAPVPEKILIKLLEFRLPVVQRKVLIDRIGKFMKLF